MFSLLAIYAILGTAGLVALCYMLMKIGALMATCPINGPQIRISALSITTGFATIGLGGLILLAAALVVLAEFEIAALASALGLGALCLGLGFTQAVATLRAVVWQIQNPVAVKAAEEGQAVPA